MPRLLSSMRLLRKTAAVAAPDCVTATVTPAQAAAAADASAQLLLPAAGDDCCGTVLGRLEDAAKYGAHTATPVQGTTTWTPYQLLRLLLIRHHTAVLTGCC
jgi:hypothetical protein